MKKDDRKEPFKKVSCGLFYKIETKKENYMEQIAEKLQELRKEKGLSQEGLALELGISRQTVSKWEAGGAVPSIENLIMLCRVFGVDITYFLSESEYAPAQAESKANTDSVDVKNSFDVEKALLNVLRRRGVVVGLWVNSFVLAIRIFITVCVGFLTISFDPAYISVSSAGLDIWHFVFSVIITVLVGVLEVYLILKVIKKPEM